MNRKISFLNPKEWWTIKREERCQIRNLKELMVTDEEYSKTLESIELMNKIRCEKRESRAKVLSAIGGVALTTLALFAAFNLDRGDEIVRNKTSMRVFEKLFKF